jgi:hypothetical protein
MSLQPMGGGIETRIDTGKPLAKDQDRKTAAQIRHASAVHEAMELSADLVKGSREFRNIIDAIRKRLLQVASEDVAIKTLLSVLVDYRFKLEILPRETEKFLHAVAGPQLSTFIEEPEVAPEGIPTEQ